MSQYLLMCRSLTYAQRAARTLERYGITAIVTKGVQDSGAVGCAYCVKVAERRLLDAVKALKNSGFASVKIFVQDDSGLIKEVER